MHRLYLLGRTDLRDARGNELRSLLAQPKRLALTAYLCLGAGEGIRRRDEIVGLFWPELTQERARKALNKAVHFVRRALGERAFVSRGDEELRVDSSYLWCDASAFLQSVAAGRLADAIELYHGELMPAFYLDDTPAFEGWLEQERARVRRLAADAARQLAEAREREGQLTSALAMARHAVALSGDADERAVRHLLTVLDRLGDRAGALCAYDTFARHLASEYQAEPSTETQAAIARIRARVESSTAINGAPVTVAAGARDPQPPTSPTVSVRPLRRTPRHVPRLAVFGVAAVVGIGAVALRAGGPSSQGYRVGATVSVAVTPAAESRPAISPDGKLVAFTVATAHGRRIAVRQVDGGRSMLLTGDLDGDYHRPRWSPDGSRLAFMAGGNGAAYVVPALGGSARRLVEPSSNAAGSFPSWSPDGTRLAYVDGTGLRVRSADSAQARLVVTGFPLHSPAWSPDGRRLAYVSGNFPQDWDLSTSSVWVVASSGGQPIRVTDALHVNLSPVWTPDGQSLLFVSNSGGGLDVYQQAITGDGRPSLAPVRLTTGLSPRNITLSADGSRMAYDVVTTRSNVWAVQLDNDRVVSLSAGRQVTAENQLITCVSVSHDGEWLAYDSDRSGNFDIYKVRIFGGEPVQLTTHPGNDFCPTWSPDDRTLAFHSTRAETRDIYTVGADGVGELQVTTGPRQDFYASWAPDGRRIAYRVREGNRFLLSIVERDSVNGWGAPRELLDFGSDRSLVGPRWSPDGSRIAFVAGGAVLVMPSAGGGPRVVADSARLGGNATWAEWSGDGSTLYVNVQERNAFWAVPITGASPHRVLVGDADHSAYRGEFATGGRRLFFVRGRSESDIGVLELKRR